MFYKGDPVLCPRLLENADKAVPVEPVIGPTVVRDLLIGWDVDPRTRLYFAKQPITPAEFGRLRSARDWIGLLGYRPDKADKTPGRVVTDPRWAAFERKCPGIFLHRHFRTDEVVDTPVGMTLYELDVEGDGHLDRIYRDRLWLGGESYMAADFETCALKEVLGAHHWGDLVRFEGKLFVASHGNTGSRLVSVYRLDSLDREVQYTDQTCFYSGISRLTEYARDRYSFNPPSERK